MTNILKAGEFVVDECTIHTTDGQSINILKPPYVLSHILIEEDIERASIFGSIIFLDSGNIASEGPIVGQETLTLKLRTASVENPDSVIDFSGLSLMIFSMENNIKVGETLKGSKIKFCSFEVMEDRRMKLSQSFEGEYSKIVEKIFRDILKSKKKLWLEETSGLKKIIAPNVSPFDVIRLAMHQAVNEGKEPTYYFWETTKGYHFRTLESMYSANSQLGSPMFNYVERTTPGGTNSNKMDILGDLASIESWEILSGTDTLLNYQDGVYASKLIEHDIFNKTYKEYEYDYLNPKEVEQHMPATSGGGFGNPLYSKTPVNQKGDTISTLKDKTFLFPVSLSGKDKKRDAHYTSLPTGKPNFKAPVASEWYQRRVSMKHQIREGKGLGIKLFVHGNTVINAGDMIHINLFNRTMDAKSRRQRKFDPIYSGPFIIKNLKHVFEMPSMSHKMEITAIKDSIPYPLGAATKSPNTDGPSSTIKGFYSGGE